MRKPLHADWHFSCSQAKEDCVTCFESRGLLDNYPRPSQVVVWDHASGRPYTRYCVISKKALV